MGVSCSADRNIKAKINRDGIWIEKLESNPGQYIPKRCVSRVKAKWSALI
jgi:fumarate hydratase class I